MTSTASPELLVRINAAQATIEKFRNTPFKWGTADCIHLVQNTLMELGYDDILKPYRKYYTEQGALRALHTAGFTCLEEFIDTLFTRIPPAAATPCDILAFECETPQLLTLGVAVSGGQAITFAETPGLAPGSPAVVAIGPTDNAVIAWRVAI